MATQIESLMLDYQGEITAGKVFEAAPELVTNVISTDEKWGLHIEWEMTGFVAKRGRDQWNVRLFLESMGKGPEYDLPSAGPIIVNNRDGVWDAVTGKRTFSKDVEIDPAVDPITPGTYRLTATLQYYDISIAPPEPLPVAGFFEGPMLQFYNPGP